MERYAVVHEFWNINGGTYDAIEYAFILSQIGDTDLVIYNKRQINIIDIIKDVIFKKYILNIEQLPFNIKIMMDNKIDRIKYKSALFIDSGIISKIPLFRSDKHFILADYIPSTLKMYQKISKLKNVHTMNEMPFFPSAINYKFKYAFNIFKQYEKLEDNTLYSNKNVVNATIIHNTKLVNNKNNLEIPIVWPINNFNQQFNRYVYNNTNYFDPRPRIFHECLFYGIDKLNIIRNIENENYDGAYYKIKSLNEEGLNNRVLDTNDELIQVMIN